MRYILVLLLLAGCHGGFYSTDATLTPKSEQLVQWCESTGPIKECMMIPRSEAQRILNNTMRNY
jgi:hypothetical protein